MLLNKKHLKMQMYLLIALTIYYRLLRNTTLYDLICIIIIINFMFHNVTIS